MTDDKKATVLNDSECQGVKYRLMRDVEGGRYCWFFQGGEAMMGMTIDTPVSVAPTRRPEGWPGSEKRL